MPSDGGGQIDHAQIDAQKVGRGKRRAIGDLHDHQQKPLPIAAHDQMTLPGFMRIKALAMVGTHEDTAPDTARHGQQAHGVETGKAHDALIVGHGRIGTKRRTDRLVAAVGACNTCQAAHSHLRRQGKPTAQLVVVEALQRQLVATLVGKRLCASQLHAALKRAIVSRKAVACSSVGRSLSCKVSSIRKTLAYLCLIYNDCMPSASAAGIAPKTGQPFFPHQPTDAVWLEHPERISGEEKDNALW